MTFPDIRIEFGQCSEADWNALVERFRDLSLLQTWAYGEAKAALGPWRPERGVFTFDGVPMGAFQALVREVPRSGLAWINRAPLWCLAGDEAAADQTKLIAMLASLRREYVDKRRFYLRIAPPLAAGVPLDFSSAGFARTDVPGWASAIVDLTASLDTIRTKLHRKWRNHLKNAEGAGLEVHSADQGSAWEDFISLHRRFTADRGPEIGVDVNLISALQSRLPSARRMTALVAYKERIPVAGMLVARYGRTAEYLAGNATAEGRTAAAGQLLLWRALEMLKCEGVSWLDLGGMDPTHTPAGIFEFKERVGGTPYRLADEIEAGGDSLIGRIVRWRVRRARRGLG